MVSITGHLPLEYLVLQTVSLSSGSHVANTLQKIPSIYSGAPNLKMVEAIRVARQARAENQSGNVLLLNGLCDLKPK